MGIDRNQAAYWMGPLSRREAQDVFDQQAKMFNGLVERVMIMDMAMACIAERGGITHEEIRAFVELKTKELQAVQSGIGNHVPKPYETNSNATDMAPITVTDAS